MMREGARANMSQSHDANLGQPCNILHTRLVFFTKSISGTLKGYWSYLFQIWFWVHWKRIWNSKKNLTPISLFDFADVELQLVGWTFRGNAFSLLKTWFWVDNKLQNELAFRRMLQHECLQFLLSFIFQHCQLSFVFCSALHPLNTTHTSFFKQIKSCLLVWGTYKR